MSARILVLRLATFAFSLSIVVTPVLAASSQGLTWGIHVGDRYDYLLSFQGYVNGELDTDLKYRAYIVVEGVPELPLSVTGVIQVWGHVNYSCYHEDGTAYLDGKSFMWNAFPIGNWSLIADLFVEHWASLDPNASIDTIDTPTLYGYNMTFVAADSIDSFSETYLKSSGVLYRFLHWFNSAGRPIMRDEIAYLSGPVQGYDTLLVIGLVAAGTTGLVGVLLFLRKRG